MGRILGTLCAAVYAAAFAAFVWLSGGHIAQRGVCSSIGGNGAIDVRAAAEAALPVPVVQFCSGTALPAILICCFAVAAVAWLGLLRWRAPAAVLAASVAISVGCAALCPYVATTDPYAYALYGYQANGNVAREPLAQLHDLFPAASIDRHDNYGPLATAEYQLIAAVSGNSLRAFIIALRTTNAALVVLCALCCILLRSGGMRKRTAALAAFHPIVLVESIAFCHGDIFMIALLCAAFAAYRKSHLATSAVLIVLAAQVRSVAGLAMLVLLADLSFARRFPELRRSVAAACAACVISVLAANTLYGHFSIGGSPLAESWSSPMLLVAGAAFTGKTQLVAGGALQALLGLAALLYALRSRRYGIVPLGALAMLPMIRAWYCQWLVPQIAITGSPPLRAMVIASCTVAIVAEWPEMTGQTGPATWVVVLALQWVVPALVCAWSALRTAGAAERPYGMGLPWSRHLS